MLTRRRFLQAAIICGAGLAVPVRLRMSGPAAGWPTVALQVAEAYNNSSGLSKFSQALRGVGPGGIPVALPDATPAPVTGVTHYTIDIGQYTDRLHPDLGLTTLRGYNPLVGLGNNTTPTHLGGIIVAQKGVPVQITFRNNLPNNHILPVDTTLMDGGLPPNRTAVHLHGGLVPWISDGTPLSWWGPDGSHGMSFTNNRVLNPHAAANEAEFYYPNNQSARMLWYHDHAHDITRLNAYAGMATAYIIRDAFEAALRSQGLPDFIENGGRELPIVIQDKIFVDASTIDTQDPTWPGSKTTGSLWYPHVYESTRWTIGRDGVVDANGNLTTDPSCVPEMFGDTMLANGTVYPVATVEARRYRLRILNACQARFLNLQLYVDDESPDGITLTKTTDANGGPIWKPASTVRKGPDFLVIGTEGGFLAKPVVVNSGTPFEMTVDNSGEAIASTLKASLLTAPAERWDLMVDFTEFEGKRVILYNDAPAPFPMGEPDNDFFPGGPSKSVVTNPGFGPNTRQIMAFQVVAATGTDPDLTISPQSDLSAGIDPLLAGLSWTTQPQLPPAGVPVRQLTLNEVFDTHGRLIQQLGTTEMVTPGRFGRAYMDKPTEVIKDGTIEVWQIINLTGDTHPMHFHLVNAQLLSRQPLAGSKMAALDGDFSVAASTLRGPLPEEVGWKETIKMHPDEVTTIIMKFDLPKHLPFNVPESANTGGHEYVWHCHILEHEEHDMMRPLVVEPTRYVYLPFE